MESEEVVPTTALRSSESLLLVPAVFVLASVGFVAIVIWQGARPDYISSWGAGAALGVALIVFGPWVLLLYVVGYVWLALALFVRGRGARGFLSIALQVVVSVLAITLVGLATWQGWSLYHDPSYGLPISGLWPFATAALVGLLGFVPVVRSVLPARRAAT